MPDFIYFIPGDKKVITAEDMRAVGLGHALDEKSGPGATQTTSGPGDQPGCLVIANGASAAPPYKPDLQTWQKGPKGAYWVGYVNSAKPGPEDLQRKKVYGDESIVLRDGNEWIVPRCVAMLDDRTATIPGLLDLDAEDGETIIVRRDPRYADLCARAYTFWLQWSRQSDPKEHLDGTQMVQLAIDALAVNYRVGKSEVIGLLRLWGTDEHGLVLRAMIDADEIDAYLLAQETEASKKSSPDERAPSVT